MQVKLVNPVEDTSETQPIYWFARNGVAANLLMGIILISGFFSIRGLKMELFPDFDLDLVTISVPYPGAAPLEVEDGICKQIEEKIWDLDGIKEMTFAREKWGGKRTSGRTKYAKLLADEIKVRVDSILVSRGSRESNGGGSYTKAQSTRSGHSWKCGCLFFA